MLGEADNKRGDLDAALARYKTAEATTSEQLARDGDNAQRIFDHAQSVFWVGYIAWQRGDHAKAKAQFTEYHRLATRLVEIDPTNDDWQAELEYSYSNLGTLAMDEGEAAEAEVWFRKALALSLAKLEKAPEDVERVIAAGQSYAWLADALHRQMDFENAKLTRISELQLYRPFLDRPEINKSVLDSSAAAEYVVAQLEFRQGAVRNAAMRAARSVEYADKLLASDAVVDESIHLGRSSLARILLAEASLALGHTADALTAASQASMIASRLATQDPTTALWRGNHLAQAKIISAKIEASRNNHLEAKSILDDLIAQQRVLAASVDSPAILKVFCAALAARARIERKSHADWIEIIDVVAESSERTTPESRALLAEALFETGDLKTAETIAAEVYERGYRHPEFMLLIAKIPGVAR